MSLQIPPDLDWLVKITAGQGWPKGDEDRMRALGREWKAFAGQLSGVTGEFEPVFRQVMDNISGQPAEQFGKFVTQMHQQLPALGEAGEQLAELSSKTAQQLEYSKYMIIAQSALLAAEIAWCVANAPLTAGGTMALVPGLIAASRLTVMQILKRLAMAVLFGVVSQFGLDVAVQAIMAIKAKLKGDDFSWNWQNTLGMVEMGAIGGAIGGGLHLGMNKLRPEGFGDTFSGMMINGGVTGVTVTGISNVMNKDDGSLGYGLTSGLAGAIGSGGGRRGHGGGVPKMGEIHVGDVDKVHFDASDLSQDVPPPYDLGEGSKSDSATPPPYQRGDYEGLPGLDGAPNQMPTPRPAGVGDSGEGRGDPFATNLRPAGDRSGMPVGSPPGLSSSRPGDASTPGVHGEAPRPQTEQEAPTPARGSMPIPQAHSPLRQGASNPARLPAPGEQPHPLSHQDVQSPARISMPTAQPHLVAHQDVSAPTRTSTTTEQPLPVSHQDAPASAGHLGQPIERGGHLPVEQSHTPAHQDVSTRPDGLPVGQPVPTPSETHHGAAPDRPSANDSRNAIGGDKQTAAPAPTRTTTQQPTSLPTHGGGERPPAFTTADAPRITTDRGAPGVHEPLPPRESVARSNEPQLPPTSHDVSTRPEDRVPVGDHRPAKAIDQLDLRLGASGELVGQAGHYLPKLPSEKVLGKMRPEQRDQLVQRHEERKQEFERLTADVVKLSAEDEVLPARGGADEFRLASMGPDLTDDVHSETEGLRDDHRQVPHGGRTDADAPAQRQFREHHDQDLAADVAKFGEVQGPAEHRPAPAPSRSPHEPYGSVTELLHDLREDSAGHPAAAEHSPLLGPDLFGLYQAPAAPHFLAGHDYRGLTAAKSVSFLDLLDMSKKYQLAHEHMDPNGGLFDDYAEWTIDHERSDDKLAAWAPGDVPPLEKTTSTPLLLHAIWLGSPLRDAGTMSAFRHNFGDAGQRLGESMVPVLWTDVPRSTFEEARATPPSADGSPDPLADVREMDQWATDHNIRLVNVNEVFNREHPMQLQEFYNSEMHKKIGPGYAAASDILRIEIMHRFGGMYSDGDNVIHGVDDVYVTAESDKGFAVNKTVNATGNSAFVMSKGHPFAQAYLDQLRENYGKSQEETMPQGINSLGQDFFDTQLGRERRNSVTIRTGPVAQDLVARRIGYRNQTKLPGIGHITTNSDMSWMKPPPAGASGPPLRSRADTLNLTKSVVQTLVRSLHNRDGDLHLTAIEPAVRKHSDPDLVWHAALSYVASHPELSGMIRTVTDTRIIDGESHHVVLPDSVRSFLRVSADEGKGHLGETQRPVAVQRREPAPAPPVSGDTHALAPAKGTPWAELPWADLRGDAPVAHVDTERFDPSVRGDARSRNGILDGWSTKIAYESRRMEFAEGEWVREFTVRLDTRADGVTDSDVRAVQDRVVASIDDHLNNRYRFENGDRFHLRVEFGGDGPRHGSVTVHGGEGSDQARWSTRAADSVLVHEVLHNLGLRDEYQDENAIFRANIDNHAVRGAMGGEAWTKPPSLTPDHLRQILEVSAASAVQHDRPLAGGHSGPEIGRRAAENPWTTTDRGAPVAERRPAPAQGDDGQAGPSHRPAPAPSRSQDSDVSMSEGSSDESFHHESVRAHDWGLGEQHPHADSAATGHPVRTDARIPKGHDVAGVRAAPGPSVDQHGLGPASRRGANQVSDARVNHWIAANAPDVTVVRDAARTLLDWRGVPPELFDREITEAALTEGFPVALHNPEGQTIALGGQGLQLKIVAIKALDGPGGVTTGAEETRRHETDADTREVTEVATRTQSDLSALLKAPTPAVTVTGRVLPSSTESRRSHRHVQSDSTELRHFVERTVDSYRVSYEVRRTGHDRAVVVAMDMQLSAPKHAEGSGGRNLDYPRRSEAATADERAQQYKDIADAINSIEHAELDTTAITDAVVRDIGEFRTRDERTRFEQWLRGLGEKDRAQALFGEDTVRETFAFKGPLGTTSRKEVLIRLRPQEQAGGSETPQLMANFLGRGEVAITHTQTSTTSESVARSGSHGVGGALSVESDALAAIIGPKLSVEMSLGRSSVEASRDGEDYGVTQSDTYHGQADTHQLDLTYVVQVGDETLLVPGAAQLTMAQQAATPPDISRMNSPTGMRHTDVLDGVHARYTMDDATVQDLSGRILMGLENIARQDGGTFDRALTKQRLVGFLRDNARDILDGTEANPGDGRPLPLGENNSAPYLFLRGHVLRHSGVYRGRDSHRRFEDTVTSGHSRGSDRSRTTQARLSVTANAGVGPVDLTGTLGLSSQTGHEHKLSTAEQAEQTWRSSGDLHRYKYGFEIEALHGDSLDEATALVLGESAHQDTVTVTVPERQGHRLGGPAELARPESEWGAPDPARPRPESRAPARYEVESMKPITGLRSASVKALTDALPAGSGVRALAREAVDWVAAGSKAASLTEAQDGLSGGRAVSQWATREARLARTTLATSGAHDRLSLERHNEGGFLGAGGRDVLGELILRTTLHNPRIVHMDPNHAFTDSHRRQTTQSSEDRRSLGVDGVFKAGMSATVPTVLKPSFAFNAKATGGLRHDTVANADHKVEVDSTTTYRARGYLVEYDAVHELTASAHNSRTGLFGGRHDAAAGRVTLVKEQPDAVTVWIDAADLRTIDLPVTEIVHLEAIDRAAYVDDHPELQHAPALWADIEPPPARPDVALPSDRLAGVGTFALDRAGALTELLAKVQEKLDEWHESIENELVPDKATEAKQLTEDVMKDLRGSLTDGFGFKVEDAVKGGLLSLQRRTTGESGRSEMLVVIEASLTGGKYRDKIEDYSSTVTYASTSDHTTKKGNILSGSVAADTGASVTLPSTRVEPVDTALGDAVGLVTDLVHPAVSGEASWDRTTGQHRHELDTVTVRQSGPAYRFSYGLNARVRVFPWLRDGLTAQYVRDMFGSDRRRLQQPWVSEPFTVPSAVRVTVGEDDHLSDRQEVATLDGRPVQVNASVRAQRVGRDPGAAEFSDDAVFHVQPFRANQLHNLVDEVAVGLETPAGRTPMLSAHRSHALRSAVSAGELVRNFRKALSPGGHRIELNGPTLKALKVELDLNLMTLVRKLDHTTLESEVASADHSGRRSDFKGQAGLVFQEGPPAVTREIVAERERDAVTTERHTGDNPGDSWFLVRAQLLSRVTPEFSDGKAPEEWNLSRKSRPEGDIRLVVNRAGLRDLGFDLDKVDRVAAAHRDTGAGEPAPTVHVEPPPGEPAVTAQRQEPASAPTGERGRVGDFPVPDRVPAFLSPADWAGVRGDAHVAQVDTERFEPSVRADVRAGGHILDGWKTRIAYESRRLEVAGGRWVREFTVRLAVQAGPGVGPHELAAVGDRVVASIDDHLNGRYRFANGDQFHLRVEFGGDGPLHGRVTVHNGEESNQARWSTGAADAVLVHEVLHNLGLRDEYRDENAVFRADVADADVRGVMGREAWEKPPSLTEAHLRQILDVESASGVRHDHPLAGQVSPGRGRGDVEDPWTTTHPDLTSVEHRPSAAERDTDEEELAEGDDLFGDFDEEHEESGPALSGLALPWDGRPAAEPAREPSVLDVDAWDAQQRAQAVLRDRLNLPWGSGERRPPWERGQDETGFAVLNANERESVFERVREQQAQGRVVTNADVWRHVYHEHRGELHANELDRLHDLFLLEAPRFDDLSASNDGHRAEIQELARRVEREMIQENQSGNPDDGPVRNPTVDEILTRMRSHDGRTVTGQSKVLREIVRDALGRAGLPRGDLSAAKAAHRAGIQELARIVEREMIQENQAKNPGKGTVKKPSIDDVTKRMKSRDGQKVTGQSTALRDIVREGLGRAGRGTRRPGDLSAGNPAHRAELQELARAAEQEILDEIRERNPDADPVAPSLNEVVKRMRTRGGKKVTGQGNLLQEIARQGLGRAEVDARKSGTLRADSDNDRREIVDIARDYMRQVREKRNKYPNVKEIVGHFRDKERDGKAVTGGNELLRVIASEAIALGERRQEASESAGTGAHAEPSTRWSGKRTADDENGSSGGQTSRNKRVRSDLAGTALDVGPGRRMFEPTRQQLDALPERTRPRPTDPNGDCLLEAVLLSAPELGARFPTPQHLRAAAVDDMTRNSEVYLPFYRGDENYFIAIGDLVDLEAQQRKENYFAAVRELRESGVYMRDAADFMPLAVARAAGVWVTVLGPDGQPMGDSFGVPSGRQITLLRLDDAGGHYLGTGPVEDGAGQAGPSSRPAPPRDEPYGSSDELLRDLQDVSAGHPDAADGSSLLGPDLFGLYQAPEPPPFMAGHDYRDITAGQSVSLMEMLDLAKGSTLTREQLDPHGEFLSDKAAWTIEHERADGASTAWAPGEHLPPLDRKTVTPLLVHAIWLGGPLRDAGTQAAFRQNFGGFGNKFRKGAVPVLWTDVPREQFDQALRTEPPADGAPDPLADVRDMAHWARSNRVRLVNVGEVFTSEHPMRLQEFYNSEVTKQVGPGYAAASDILRMEVMHRFGGMYSDGDNVILGLKDLHRVARSDEGYAIQKVMDKGYKAKFKEFSNSAFVMSKGHPFAKEYLDQLRENYGKSQDELMPHADPEFLDAPRGFVRRNSVMYRTGPEVIRSVAKRIGYQDHTFLPGMRDVVMNSDASWLKPPPEGNSPLPHDRRSTFELTKKVVQTLVRGIHNRGGDLHLTAVEPAVRRHPNPDLVWHAALSYLTSHPDLSRQITSVTDRRTVGGVHHDVALPESVRSLLDISSTEERYDRGDTRRPATVVAEVPPAADRHGSLPHDPGAHDPVRSVVDDESWRHSRERSAPWFEPDRPLRVEQWEHLRRNDLVRTVQTEIADVKTSSRVDERGRPEFEQYRGLVRYDVRRIEVEPGRFVREHTVRLHLSGDAEQVAQARRDAADAVELLLNKGYRLPSGDQFHVRLEFPDSARDAHATVEVGGRPTDQTHWRVGEDPKVLAHEVLHYLGPGDEYLDRSRVFLDKAWKSAVVADNGLLGAGLRRADVELKPRNLWFVERVARDQVEVPETRLNEKYDGLKLGQVNPRVERTVVEPTRPREPDDDAMSVSSSDGSFHHVDAQEHDWSLGEQHPDDTAPPWQVDARRGIARAVGGALARDGGGVELFRHLHRNGVEHESVRALEHAFRSEHQGTSLPDALSDARESGRLSDAQYEQALQLLGYRQTMFGDPAHDLRATATAGPNPSSHASVQMLAIALRQNMQLGRHDEVLTLLRGVDRDARTIWAVNDAYLDMYWSPLNHDLQTRLPAEHRAYVDHLLGGVSAEAVPEHVARQWFAELDHTTFEHAEHGRLPVPIGYPEQGCYLRAHMWALRLTQLGAPVRKIFLAQADPQLEMLSETADGATKDHPVAVNWDYHVAPVVWVRKETGDDGWLVFDPVMRAGLLTPEEWATRAGAAWEPELFTGSLREMHESMREDMADDPRSWTGSGVIRYPLDPLSFITDVHALDFPYLESSVYGNLRDADREARTEDDILAEHSFADMERQLQRGARDVLDRALSPDETLHELRRLADGNRQAAGFLARPENRQHTERLLAALPYSRYDELWAIFPSSSDGETRPAPGLHEPSSRPAPAAVEESQTRPAPDEESSNVLTAAIVDVDLDQLELYDPTWRTDDDPLYRYDSRRPDEIFEHGFAPRSRTDYDLMIRVEADHDTVFVSTTRDSELHQHHPGGVYARSGYRYEIRAPHGIDVNETALAHSPLYEHEREVVFPGGVHRRYIRGVHELRDGVAVQFIPNPWFEGSPGHAQDSTTDNVQHGGVGREALAEMAGGGHQLPTTTVFGFDEGSHAPRDDDQFRLAGLAENLARIAVWRHDNGLPLPEVTVTGYGNGRPFSVGAANRTGLERARAVGDRLRAELAARLGDDRPITVRDIRITDRSAGRDVGAVAGSVQEARRRVVVDFHLPEPAPGSYPPPGRRPSDGDVDNVRSTVEPNLPVLADDPAPHEHLTVADLDLVRDDAPVSRVDGVSEHGRFSYDVRRIEARPGAWVHEATLNVHVDGRAVEAIDVRQVLALVDIGVEEMFNRKRLPNGDQLWVRVVPVDDPGDAHASVEIVSDPMAESHEEWSMIDFDFDLAQKVGKLLGLGDHEGHERLTADHLRQLQLRTSPEPLPYSAIRIEERHDWFTGRDDAGHERVFPLERVTHTDLRDGSDRLIGVSFDSNAMEIEESRRWARSASSDQLYLREVDRGGRRDFELRTTVPGISDESAVLMVHSDDRHAAVVVRGVGPVVVDSRTLAAIAMRTEGFKTAVASGRRTVMLLACMAGVHTGPGSFAHDLRLALRHEGVSDRVFAPSTQATPIARDGGRTAVLSDGGNWNVFGDMLPSHEAAIVDELVQAMRYNWRYEVRPAPQPDGKIGLADRAKTLALASTLVNDIAARPPAGGRLDLADVLRKAEAHERPDIVAAVVMSRITTDPVTARLVRSVVHEVGDVPVRQVPSPEPTRADSVSVSFGRGRTQLPEAAELPDVDRFADRFVAVALERQASGLPLPIAAVVGYGKGSTLGDPRATGEATGFKRANQVRDYLVAKVRQKLDLLSSPDSVEFDVRRLIPESAVIGLHEAGRANPREAVITMYVDHGTVDRPAVAATLSEHHAHRETVDLVLSMVDETVDNTRVAEGRQSADRLAAAVPGAVQALESAGVIDLYVREAGDPVTAGLMLNHVVDAVARAWVDEGETAATALAESFYRKGSARDVR
ncbi:protein-glutamine glutaminase family protein [Kutzneria sp. NPDC052558]|uniref:scabin-related ADP-ribosyltransferase n=1 Tax=Kutzneria sp. NPDC052558 TaxID=3364121 RepID=UPI0037C6ACE5